MRNLLIALFALICLTAINSQAIDGTWNVDWQNNPYGSLCVPDSMSIATNSSNAVNVNYTYSAQVVQNNCPYIVNFTSDVLSTFDTNAYNDTIGRTVRQTGNVVTFTANGTAIAFFYQVPTDPSVIPQPFTIGTLGSYWGSPTAVNPPATGCCFPDSIYIAPNGPVSTNQLFYSTFFITTSCAANFTNANLTLSNSSATTVNWADSANTAINFAFTPSQSWLSVNVTFTPTCVFTYQRVNATGLISGSWQQDWQSVPNATFPANYNISQVSETGNITYMTSKYLNGANTVSGFVVQPSSNIFTDSALAQTFQYNQATNTLLSGNFLYSPNGSLFNPANFVNFWGVPQGGAANCCVPSYISITPNNATTLNVNYILPEGWATNTGCAAFSSQVTGNSIASILAVTTPSVTSLIWNDVNLAGTQVFFTTATSTAQISANLPGQCPFTMTPTNPPPALGTWNMDWQNNNIGSLCVPSSFNIITNETAGFNVTYVFSPSVILNNCGAVAPPTNTPISFVSTNLWADTVGNKISFTPNAVFTPNGSTTSFFYQLPTDNTAIPQMTTFGLLGATWNTQLTPAETCCAPDQLFIAPLGNSNTNQLSYSAYYISSNCSNNVTNVPLSLSGSTLTVANWVDNTTKTTVDIAFTPATSWVNIVGTFNGNATCSFTYTRGVMTGQITGNWQQDWQSMSNVNIPANYQINISNTGNTTGNVNYMTSNFALNGTAITGYVVQPVANQFMDTALSQTFNYDNGTNTLLSGDFLYSPTGSLFSPTPFINYWGVPQTSGDIANCCVPTYINITADPTSANLLSVVYTLPEGFATNSGCQQFQDAITGSVIDSTLMIATPSITQLVWNDTLLDGVQISFANTTTTAQIVANLPNQCAVTMTITTPPTPPGPLSGSWISTKVMTVVMGLFMLFACI